MTLIKSISGIRGIVGGQPGKGLTPADIIDITASYGMWLMESHGDGNVRVVTGRDARVSGEAISHIVSGTLMSVGIDVIDLSLSTTPTVEIAVTEERAQGGIIITASHNPAEWNALKLLNGRGEFISDEDGKWIIDRANRKDYRFAVAGSLGMCVSKSGYIERHIEKILVLPVVDRNGVASRGFRVAVDAVNSTGGIAVPLLLKALGVNDVVLLNCTPDGHFPHNPEPLPENLAEIARKVVEAGADLGLVVDPDVDRLAIVCENGEMFGEEYTLVAVADYILQKSKGKTPLSTVSNLSSTIALREITLKAGGKYFPSAVGEVNVVRKMKEVNAVIGGEGNGGVIYPALHYGRDALVGIALFLSHLAESGMSCSELRGRYPSYFISKNKIELDSGLNIDDLLDVLKRNHKAENLVTVDGLKAEYEGEWVHLRRSNTEPIIRIYAESDSWEKADNLAQKWMQEIVLLAKGFQR